MLNSLPLQPYIPKKWFHDEDLASIQQEKKSG